MRLWMRGSIRLSGRWLPFSGRELLAPRRGFEWRARAHLGPLGVTGYDRLRRGQGEMRWRLFGLVPVMRASGEDVTRSARGRTAAEAIWAPGALAGADVAWRERDDGWVAATFPVAGESCEVALDLGEEGELRAVALERWGNPDGEGWRPLDFGAAVEEERAFGPITLPARLRVGWWFGSERFADDGEFFRCEVERVKPAG